VTLTNVFGALSLDATTAAVRDNVATATARLEAIRDRLPASLNADGGLAVHVQNPQSSVSVSNLPATQPVSGTFWQATQPVSGPLTDTQLRASAVPVSGPLTDAQLRATAVPTADSRLPAALDANGGVKTSIQNASVAVTGTFYQATQPVSGTVTATGPLTDTQLRASAVPVTASTVTAGTATQTNVAAAITSTTLKASNTARKALYIYNAGTADLYVNFGATATATTAFVNRLPPGSFWELPDDPIYTGAVNGIWSATGGNGANVVELT
jgi:hypothetical protein